MKTQTQTRDRATRGIVRRTLIALVAFAAMATATGCAVFGYRLGTTLPRDLKTIHVPIFSNDTGEPLLESETTEAVTDAIQKDGALRVVTSPARADLLLDVRLTSYSLEPLGYDDDRLKSANEYRLILKASVLCTRRKSKDVLVSSRATGKTTFVPGGGMSLSKSEALPEAAEDLAHNIVEQIVEAW